MGAFACSQSPSGDRALGTKGTIRFRFRQGSFRISQDKCACEVSKCVSSAAVLHLRGFETCETVSSQRGGKIVPFSKAHSNANNVFFLFEIHPSISTAHHIPAFNACCIQVNDVLASLHHLRIPSEGRGQLGSVVPSPGSHWRFLLSIGFSLTEPPDRTGQPALQQTSIQQTSNIIIIFH